MTGVMRRRSEASATIRPPVIASPPPVGSGRPPSPPWHPPFRPPRTRGRLRATMPRPHAPPPERMRVAAHRAGMLREHGKTGCVCAPPGRSSPTRGMGALGCTEVAADLRNAPHAYSYKGRETPSTEVWGIWGEGKKGSHAHAGARYRLTPFFRVLTQPQTPVRGVPQPNGSNMSGVFWGRGRPQCTHRRGSAHPGGPRGPSALYVWSAYRGPDGAGWRPGREAAAGIPPGRHDPPIFSSPLHTEPDALGCTEVGPDLRTPLNPTPIREERPRALRSGVFGEMGKKGVTRMRGRIIG
ncbi:hypothetical protein D2E22_0221 [Bifidobacterium castoris]|uniref:Uncharacterized protein n=1 Tax=Bifidobacterium castoris TaxID=2306972 RepID=A0A430FA92_9BIFI|nr:hypothetical protein D2E22_0221 [Bifidobacterium castoris]